MSSSDPRNDPPVTLLEVRYASRRALLSSAKTERGSLTLFVPTSRAVAQGTRVLLTLTFEDAGERFELEGLALNRTQAIGRDGVGGFLVSFQGEHKRHAAEMIAFCAGRPSLMGTASRERLAIRKNCQLKLADGQVAGELRDLSQTGAFVVCRKLASLKVGDPVCLKVDGGLFGMGGIWLEARLVWKGEKGEERGVGLRFTGNEARQASVIQRLLERAVPKR
jgi:Tfp pilus assembly protein PilZ